MSKKRESAESNAIGFFIVCAISFGILLITCLALTGILIYPEEIKDITVQIEDRVTSVNEITGKNFDSITALSVDPMGFDGIYSALVEGTISSQECDPTLYCDSLDKCYAAECEIEAEITEEAVVYFRRDNKKDLQYFHEGEEVCKGGFPCKFHYEYAYDTEDFLGQGGYITYSNVRNPLIKSFVKSTTLETEVNKGFDFKKVSAFQNYTQYDMFKKEMQETGEYLTYLKGTEIIFPFAVSEKVIETEEEFMQFEGAEYKEYTTTLQGDKHYVLDSEKVCSNGFPCSRNGIHFRDRNEFERQGGIIVYEHIEVSDGMQYMINDSVICSDFPCTITDTINSKEELEERGGFVEPVMEEVVVEEQTVVCNTGNLICFREV